MFKKILLESFILSLLILIFFVEIYFINNNLYNKDQVTFKYQQENCPVNMYQVSDNSIVYCIPKQFNSLHFENGVFVDGKKIEPFKGNNND